MNKGVKLKQPSQLRILFFVELWERYGFYTMLGLLMLFMTKSFHWSDARSYALFAAFSAFLWVTPAIGGYIADNFLGYRRSLIVGACLLCLAYVGLALPGRHFFYLSLAFLIVGMGFFKFVPSTLLGRSYSEKDTRVDSGYTLFYMGINVGSLLAFVLCGYVAHAYGWRAAFALAAVGVIIGLAVFMLFRRHFVSLDNEKSLPALTPLRIAYFTLGVVAMIAFMNYALMHVELADISVILIGIALLVYISMMFLRLNGREQGKLIAAIILVFVAMIFFSIYIQQPMSLVLFTDRNVNHTLLGIPLHSSTFLSMVPIGIILWSPLLAWAYVKLQRHHINISIAMKFGLGIVVVGLSLLIFYFSPYFANAQSKVSAWWIIGSYTMESLAELLVSALGLSMVVQLVPRKMLGTMMGGWFIATAIGSLLGGVLAKMVAFPKGNHVSASQSLHIYVSAFTHFGLFIVFAGLVVCALAPAIMRLADKPVVLRIKPEEIQL